MDCPVAFPPSCQTPGEERVDDLTLHQVAEEIGVHYMTAYRYVRLGILPAHREGRQWRVRRADLDALQAGLPSPALEGRAPWEDRLFSRLVDGDEPGAWWVLEAALAAGHDPADIVTGMLAPALERVGREWEAGELGISDEHAASIVASRVLGRLGSRSWRRGASRGAFVVGGTASELHGLPLAMAAELTRLAGFQTLDLGPRLPAEAFAAAARSVERLVAVGVGVTTTGHEDEARQTVAALKAAVAVPVILGGAGIANRDAALGMGADEWARSGADLVATLDRLVSGS